MGWHVQQKFQPVTHVRSSVGARPSSAAPVQQDHLHHVDMRIPFFCDSVARVLSSINLSISVVRITVLLDGGEDGRAPTEELSSVKQWDFCSTRRWR